MHNIADNALFMLRFCHIPIGKAEQILEISPGYLSRMRQHEPKIGVVLKLAKGLNLTVEELTLPTEDFKRMLSEKH